MGKEWDGGDIAFRPETWAAVYDALKPGAHLIAFSGTRTYHRMACAIEDAGFEIRDCLMWVYGSGFPKSHNVSKAIDRANDEAASAAWQGWGTALKPALEPICFARKPLSEKTVAANVLKHGTGAINVDGARIGTDTRSRSRSSGEQISPSGSSFGAHYSRVPDAEVIGRWPANLIHDGSDEVLEGFPETSSGALRPQSGAKKPSSALGKFAVGNVNHFTASEGSASRFFYSAKAGPLDRMGTAHATVKPVDLMRWLVRLVTQPGGRVLDPFAGSGKTGIACMAEGFDCDMIDIEAEHVADIERQLAFLRGEGRSRFAEHNHAKAQRAGAEKPIGGLFAEDAA
jgi:site-specific DNA-methyltransferase (adenine-specific)